MPDSRSRGDARGAVTATAVLLATALAVALPAGAGASLRAADETLARTSAAAVRGRVVALRTAWDPDVSAIYTYVTLDVATAWGLTAAPPRLTVKQLGGTVGATALVIGGQARFAVGEEVLVFLEVRPRDHTLAVAGLAAGKWTLEDAGADRAATVARDLGGLDPSASPARETRAVDELDRLAALAGTTVRAATVRFDGGLAEADGPATAADFTLLSPATPARWHEADHDAPVYVDADAGGHPQIAGGGIAQGVAGAALWSGAAALTLAPGVLRAPRCFQHADAADGRISITYGDPCQEIPDSSPTLAIGGAYFSASDVRTLHGVPFWKITAGMVVLDDVAAKFATMSAGCYADVVAHELGHAIGLGHATTAAALMAPTLSAGCAARSSGMPLGIDDLAGARLLYPLDEPVPGAPNGLGAAVSGGTVTVFWGAPLWGTPPTGYRLEAGSAPGLNDRGLIKIGSTTFVTSGVPNGEYHLRVRAVSGSVVGLPTPDVRVVVGGPPPGPPQAVSGSSGPGGAALVTWAPPAGGDVTSYVVEVGLAPGTPAIRYVVAGTALGGHGVPAGTYYVRVVAMNGTAASTPSDEIALIVP